MWAYLQQVDWSKQHACHIQCYIPLTKHNCYITREIWIQLGAQGGKRLKYAYITHVYISLYPT